MTRTTRYVALAILQVGCVGVSYAPHKGAFAPARDEAEEGYVADFDVEAAQASMIAPAAGDAPAADRLVVRTGALTLRTGNPAEVGQKASATVQKAGGWVVKRENDFWIFRVPAARFEEIFLAFEALGAVVHREMQAADVTDEMRDVELRIKNAHALRDRYEELLKRAEKVEDLLAIERQLAQATELIERLEGQLKARQQEVAMSLLTLRLEPVRSGRVVGSRSPFPWLASIGVEQLPTYRSERAYGSRVRWGLPADFADMGRIRDSDILAWAYSPEGIRLVVRRFDHKPAANSAFWEKEVLRELVKARGYEEEEPRVPGILRFRTLADGQPTTYGVRLIVTDRSITVVEVIGPSEVLQSHWSRIEPVLQSVEEDAR